MSGEFKYTTALRKHPQHGYLRAEVRYTRVGGNKYPSFAITSDWFDRTQHLPGETHVVVANQRWYLGACGCLHDEIRTLFPELAPFLVWHGTFEDAPMHYVANGTYWHKLWGDAVAGAPWDQDEYVMRYGAEKLRTFFLDTICYGQVPSDQATPPDTLLVMDKPEVTAWLEARLPALQERFQAALQELRDLESVLTQGGP